MTTVPAVQIVHETLHGAARALPAQVTVLDDTHQTLLSRQVPAAAFANVDASSAAGAAHTRTVEENARALATAGRRLDTMIADIRGTTAIAQEWDKNKATQQTDEGARKIRLAEGNTPAKETPERTGLTPNDIRNIQNRREIGALQSAELAKQARLEQQLADHRAKSWGLGPDRMIETFLEREIAQTEARVATYGRLLGSETMILEFGTEGNGRYVGLVGDLDKARAVAVFVPGTGVDLQVAPDWNQVVRGFARPDVATVVYLNGDLPSNLVEASFSSYAREMAPV